MSLAGTGNPCCEYAVAIAATNQWDSPCLEAGWPNLVCPKQTKI